MEKYEDQQPPLEIPANVLSPEALAAVIESFVLREGTDYGAKEVSLSSKAQQVRKQLDKGQIKIIFDPGTDSFTLMTERDWQKFHPAGMQI